MAFTLDDDVPDQDCAVGMNGMGGLFAYASIECIPMAMEGMTPPKTVCEQPV